VAAPTETRTPNLHRANKKRSSKSADGRVATGANSVGEKKEMIHQNQEEST
jgi:hypothetical protein